MQQPLKSIFRMRCKKLTEKYFDISNLNYKYHAFSFVTKKLLLKMILLHPWVMPLIQIKAYIVYQWKPSACLACWSNGYCGHGSHDCGGLTILWKSHFQPNWVLSRSIKYILLHNLLQLIKTYIELVVFLTAECHDNEVQQNYYRNKKIFFEHFLEKF